MILLTVFFKKLNRSLLKREGTTFLSNIIAVYFTNIGKIKTSLIFVFLFLIAYLLSLSEVSDFKFRNKKSVEPSTSSITAKLNNDIISGQTALTAEPADTDEFLVSDGGTIKKIDYSLIKAPDAGGMTLLSTTTLSGTTTSVSISSTGYLKLLISIEDMVGSTGDTKFTFNSDSGSKYKLVRMIGDASNSPSTNSQQTTGVHINQNGAAGYLSTSKLSAIIDVYFPASTTRYKSFLSNTVGDYSSQRIAMLTSGIYASDNAITSFQLICGTGSFTGGTILIYGVK